MAGELIVKPGVVDRASSDCTELGVSMLRADMYLNQYVTSDYTGGEWITDAGSVLVDAARLLDDNYGQYARACLDSGHRLTAMAKSYRETDSDEWRRFDRMLTDSESAPKVDVDTVDPGFDYSEFNGFFGSPGSAFDGWVETFYDIEDKINQIISLGDELSQITILGFENPFAKWAEEWSGTWGQFGVGSAALKGLADYWERVAAEATATAGRFPGKWEGQAADAVTYWLGRLAEEADNHAPRLRDKADEVFAKALFMNECLTPILDIGADLVDTVTTAASLQDDIWDIVKAPWKIFSEVDDMAKKLWDMTQKIVGLLKHAGKVINAFRIAASFLYAVIEDFKADDDIRMYIFFGELDKMKVGR